MKKKIYIFVLCPPFQGSSMIVNLLNSSNNVSTFINNKHWPGESQWFFKLNGDKNYESNRWNPNYKLNMKMVDKILNKYLDHSKQIWIEKNPPSICRAKLYQDYFSNLGKVYFILSIRSPYSTGHYDAKHWIEFAKYQRFNLENLKNTIFINYEECCNNLDSVISKIKNKIPEIGQIYNNNNKIINNERGRKINSNKVNRIIDKEKKNKILKKNINLLNYFGYKIID